MIFKKKTNCENCKSELKIKKLNEKQVQEKIAILIEQGNEIGGLAPKNAQFKNFGLVVFLLENCYTYYECPKCGWFKFKKELSK